MHRAGILNSLIKSLASLIIVQKWLKVNTLRKKFAFRGIKSKKPLDKIVPLHYNIDVVFKCDEEDRE